MAKKKSLKEQLQAYTEELHKSISEWCNIRDNGCNDPFWEDGTNLNLVHNHIIFYKNALAELLGDKYILYPEDFFIPVPPEVLNDFMRFDDERRLHLHTNKSTWERDKNIIEKWGSFEYAVINKEKICDDGMPF